MQPFPRRPLVALALAALAGAAACKGTGAPRAPAEDRLVVFAAASLRDAFTAMGAEFERAHPGARVTFNFAGTQELRTQLEHGAPADVFASADMKHMSELTHASLVGDPVVFVRNEPVVVVARESAGSIKTFSDLPAAERVVIGVPEVPIGRYTLEILDRASASLGADFRKRVEAKVVSREPNVRQVLAKVSLGEASAAIVYRTDAHAAGRIGREVAIVPIPPALNVIAEYPIAAVRSAAHPKLARAWIDDSLSAQGRRLLLDAGFLTPGS
jgi:molybdate transport system substrate-binding protein